MLLLATLAAAASACDAGASSEVAPEPAANQATEAEVTEPDPSTTEPEASAEDASNQDAPLDLPFESGDGRFQMDSESYEAEWVVRCLPRLLDIEEPHEDDLALIAYIGDQTALQLDLTYQEIVLTPDDERNYTAVYADLFLSRSGTNGLEQFETTGLATGPEGDWFDLRDADAGPLQLALGNEGANPLPEPAASIQGGRVAGTVDMTQVHPDGGTATVTVTYDLSIPTEEFDCDEL